MAQRRPAYSLGSGPPNIRVRFPVVTRDSPVEVSFGSPSDYNRPRRGRAESLTTVSARRLPVGGEQANTRPRRMTIGGSLSEETSRANPSAPLTKSVLSLHAPEVLRDPGKVGINSSGISSPLPGSRPRIVFGAKYNHGEPSEVPGRKKTERVLYGATYRPTKDMRYEAQGERRESNVHHDRDGETSWCWGGRMFTYLSGAC